MRKMIVFCEVGYCGMGSVEALLVDDDATQKEIDEIAWEMALANAEMFGYYPPSDEYEEEDPDYVSEGIEGCAVDYDPEKHDGHSRSGSFEDDFAMMR